MWWSTARSERITSAYVGAIRYSSPSTVRRSSLAILFTSGSSLRSARPWPSHDLCIARPDLLRLLQCAEPDGRAYGGTCSGSAVYGSTSDRSWPSVAPALWASIRASSLRTIAGGRTGNLGGIFNLHFRKPTIERVVTVLSPAVAAFLWRDPLALFDAPWLHPFQVSPDDEPLGASRPRVDLSVPPTTGGQSWFPVDLRHWFRLRAFGR